MNVFQRFHGWRKRSFLRFALVNLCIVFAVDVLLLSSNMSEVWTWHRIIIDTVSSLLTSSVVIAIDEARSSHLFSAKTSSALGKSSTH